MAAQSHYGTTIFGGLLAAIAEGLGGPASKAWPAVSAVESQAPAPTRRSDDLFASLDRWLWKLQVRETEAWLAQSQDIFELESRIRHLERNGGGRLF
jgi:hypothetical protein